MVSWSDLSYFSIRFDTLRLTGVLTALPVVVCNTMQMLQATRSKSVPMVLQGGLPFGLGLLGS